VDRSTERRRSQPSARTGFRVAIRFNLKPIKLINLRPIVKTIIRAENSRKCEIPKDAEGMTIDNILLAAILTFLHCKIRPAFYSRDGILFQLPVQSGSSYPQ